MEFSKRLIFTIKDIGPKRLCKRIGYELRKTFDKFIPDKISLIIIGFKANKFTWQNNLSKLKIQNHKIKFINSYKKDETIIFKFLNSKKTLCFPIIWNNQSWERLWQFNLHYFDWARNSIELFNDKKIVDNYLLRIPLFIDQWIENNHLGKGDGWHSYTLSLRIRNWVWILKTFPEIKNDKILNSIWKQLCWLINHLEDANGGNHYLENLCALIIVSLQFESKKSQDIYSFAMNNLKKELKLQILSDGGHQERTASYHILILDRLVEVGFVLESSKNKVPDWLLRSITLMLNWLNLIKLKRNKTPRFNDSPEDGCPKISKVIAFANCFIYKENPDSYKLGGIRKKLIEERGINKISIKKINNNNNSQNNSIINLQETGWIFIKPDKNWEIIFKSGKSCPNHLPGHAHSDLFSFDIYKNGIPIISEAGTSTYEMNVIRSYERSGQAHNTFEIIQQKSQNKRNNIQVIEPVDIWSSFRAGRKAKTFGIGCGIDSNGIFWVNGSHDGYQKINVNYSRKLFFNLDINLNLKINIVDNLITKNSLPWRKWIHFSPRVNEHEFQEILNYIKKNNQNNFKVFNTSYAYGFGKRKTRKSICFFGVTNKGISNLKTKVTLFNSSGK